MIFEQKREETKSVVYSKTEIPGFSWTGGSECREARIVVSDFRHFDLLFEKWTLLFDILSYFSKSGLYFSTF